MVIPLYDDNPTKIKPVVTVAIIATCLVVYLLQHPLLPDAGTRYVAHAFGVIPSVLTGAQYMPEGYDLLPPWATVVTSMFLHGGFWHFLGNMWFLWIFGNNIEDAMGHVRFVVFYLLCGVAAVAAQVLPNPGSDVPMVGASGAISGVLGAYMLLFPRRKVALGIPTGFLIIYIGKYPAVWVLAAWFVMQLVNSVWQAVQQTAADQGGIAFGAHIGGFVAGMLLIPIFKYGHFPLWPRQ